MGKILLTLIFSLFAVADLATGNDSDPSPTNLDHQLILKLVNERRTTGCNCGTKYMPAVPPLIWSDVIAAASIGHSKDMNQRNFFSHTSSNGQSLKDRFNAVGYKWMAIGENIAMGQRDEFEVVNAWIKSPGHCMNLMSVDFKEMGAARAGKYWTQDFGKKRTW
ncbi:MAG: CAP domain-containing protein [Pedobacter sp.]|nr:CAP domain-containing protein [Pedobacter sp.]MDQ8054279.1 CAP domain-containing protein [Pedobacter sp.]